MSQNTMLDVHNHLLAALERLGDEDLKGEELEHEVHRAQAIRGIAHEVVANANVILKAEQMRVNDGAQIPQIMAGQKQEKPHPVLVLKNDRTLKGVAR